MFKKLILATLLSLNISSTFADTAYVAGSLSVINNASNGGRSDYRGLSGNLAFGYGGIVAPRIYLGGEIFAIPGSFTVTGNDNLKTTWGVGLSFIPGIMLNEKTMTYARIGMIDSHFSKENQTAIGGQLGLGIQTIITQNLNLRGEYVYSKYRSLENFSSPNADVFNVGLVYKF